MQDWNCWSKNTEEKSFLFLTVIIFNAAIAGVAAYNNHKLRKEASRGSSNDSESAISVPTTSADSNK